MTAAKTIGGYTVLARLGQGGMAEVLLALKPGPAGFRKLLVIKQLRKELVSDEEYLTMFLDEARLAARLAHTNVVRTYEVGEHEDGYYIAMDYLEGQPFGRVLRRRDPALPLPARIRILGEVLAGLHYAHEVSDFDGSPLHVIHRDVSPQNVFITYSGGVQLLDFGIAKAAGGSSQTRKGTFKGKVAYIAPEQALGEAIDRRADIFSVGVMLWEAVTLKRLSRGDQDLVRLKARIDGSEPRLRDVAPDTDPILLDACDRAMALDPKDRFQTAEEFQNALQPFLTKSTPTPRELGAWMSDEFAEDRQALANEIEAQVRRHEQTQSEDVPIVDIVGPISLTPLTGSIPPRDEETKFNPMWLGALLAAAVIIGVVVVTGGDSTEPDPGTETPQELNAVAAAPDIAAPPEATPIVQSLELSVEAEPSEATVFIDGVEVENPYRSTVSADDEEHRVRVVADGFRDHEQTIRFDQDQDLNISLMRTQPSVAVGRPTMQARRVARMTEATMTSPPVEPTMQPSMVNAVTPEPAQTAETPMVTPMASPTGMQVRQIDVTDPY